MHGVSTRKVDDLVQALGACVGDLQVRGQPHLCRARQGAGVVPHPPPRPRRLPLLFCDATYVKGRVRGRVVSRAVVVATGVSANGDREVLGIDVGDSEDGAFWTAFLRACAPGASAGVRARHLRSPPRAQRRPSTRSSSGRPGSGAGSTSCATSWPRCPEPRPRWWRPPSARSSPSPTPPTCGPSSTRSPPCCAAQFPDVADQLADAGEDLLGLLRLPVSRTGASSGRPTRSSG